MHSRNIVNYVYGVFLHSQKVAHALVPVILLLICNVMHSRNIVNYVYGVFLHSQKVAIWALEPFGICL